jgi:hypothetical protein
MTGIAKQNGAMPVDDLRWARRDCGKQAISKHLIDYPLTCPDLSTNATSAIPPPVRLLRPQHFSQPRQTRFFHEFAHVPWLARQALGGEADVFAGSQDQIRVM